VRTASLALVAVALLLAGCGGSAGSGSRQTTTEDGIDTSTTSSRVILITVKGGKPAGGITRVTVAKGTHVEVVVHSDVADEVHMHGYDLHEDVKAGGVARIAFDAKITGVFEAELESRSLQVLELTVK
jgi:hypothetical protein